MLNLKTTLEAVYCTPEATLERNRRTMSDLVHATVKTPVKVSMTTDYARMVGSTIKSFTVVASFKRSEKDQPLQGFKRFKRTFNADAQGQVDCIDCLRKVNAVTDAGSFERFILDLPF